MKLSQLNYLQQFQNQLKAKPASALTAAKILTKTNKKAGHLAGFFIRFNPEAPLRDQLPDEQLERGTVNKIRNQVQLHGRT